MPCSTWAHAPATHYHTQNTPHGGTTWPGVPFACPLPPPPPLCAPQASRVVVRPAPPSTGARCPSAARPYERAGRPPLLPCTRPPASSDADEGPLACDPPPCLHCIHALHLFAPGGSASALCHAALRPAVYSPSCYRPTFVTPLPPKHTAHTLSHTHIYTCSTARGHPALPRAPSSFTLRPAPVTFQLLHPRSMPSTPCCLGPRPAAPAASDPCPAAPAASDPRPAASLSFANAYVGSQAELRSCAARKGEVNAPLATGQARGHSDHHHHRHHHHQQQQRLTT